MKVLTIIGFAIMISLLLSQAATAQTPNLAPDYDAVRDFSGQSNPNGVWSYGYSTAWGAPFKLNTVSCHPFQGASQWAESVCDQPAAIMHDDTGKKLCHVTWCMPPTYILSSPGPDGELSILRWTAPSSGRFLMQVTFEGMDYAGPTSTFVHVLQNSKQSLLKAPITSYHWPGVFDPKAVRLVAEDTVDFIVDWGKDRSYDFDTTGIEVKIWNLSLR
jgi:hypothetical protein